MGLTSPHGRKPSRLSRLRRRLRARCGGSLLPLAVLAALAVAVALPLYRLCGKLREAGGLTSAAGGWAGDGAGNWAWAGDWAGRWAGDGAGRWAGDGAGDVDRLPLQRDILQQEAWPGVEGNDSEPTQVSHWEPHR